MIVFIYLIPVYYLGIIGNGRNYMICNPHIPRVNALKFKESPHTITLTINKYINCIDTVAMDIKVNCFKIYVAKLILAIIAELLY